MITLTPVDLHSERDEVVGFLSSQQWPYHATSNLDARDIAAMSFALPETASFWVLDDGARVGLIRLQDLADIEDGSPVVDLRLASDVRGRGVGRLALGLLCDLSFTRWPELRRIEGTTRDDNAAMQRVFEVCGFQREGCLRETWPTQEGRWRDTLVYGLLRRERSSLTKPR
ncbi:MAG: GNAT family N-acetyltransferase [Burkholderiales bacterium]|jgi:RimJ/RimL family protein N-acetyltransferase